MGLVERAKRLPQAYTVGGRRIFPNVFCAPMSGVTDTAFRRLLVRITGGRTGLLVSEFVSVEGLSRRNPLTVKEMAFSPKEERPFTVQIFGSQAHKMALGAQVAAGVGADFVEINCGCPAPKVVSKGGGSGLLRDLPNLARVLRSVVTSVPIPVTIKVRVGWDENLITLYETLRIAEGEGAQAFIIHGRTRTQAYRGLANWDLIAEAKAKAKIPVIGNGDVLRVEHILEKLERYGVDGVAIGRGAMHNPWVFRDIADVYAGKEPQEPTPQEQLQMLMTYLELLREESPYEGRILGKLKQMTARLMKLQRGGGPARLAMLRSQALQEFLDHLQAYFEGPDGALGRDLDRLDDLNGRHEAGTPPMER